MLLSRVEECKDMLICTDFETAEGEMLGCHAAKPINCHLQHCLQQQRLWQLTALPPWQSTALLPWQLPPPAREELIPPSGLVPAAVYGQQWLSLQLPPPSCLLPPAVPSAVPAARSAAGSCTTALKLSTARQVCSVNTRFCCYQRYLRAQLGSPTATQD